MATCHVIGDTLADELTCSLAALLDAKMVDAAGTMLTPYYTLLVYMINPLLIHMTPHVSDGHDYMWDTVVM